MDKLTVGLVAAAAALGFFASRDARKAHGTAAPAAGAPPPDFASQKPARPAGDDGMVILRNDPIDQGMVVRSPFDGDRGIVRSAGPGDQPRLGDAPDQERPS